MLDEAGVEELERALKKIDDVDAWFKNLKPEELKRLQEEHKRMELEAEKEMEELDDKILEIIFDTKDSERIEELKKLF